MRSWMEPKRRRRWSGSANSYLRDWLTLGWSANRFSSNADMSHFIWYKPLEGVGELAVDLHTGRRFVVETYEPHNGRFTELIYYMLLYLNKIMWIECRGFEDVVDEAIEPHLEYQESYREVDPRQVAYDLLTRKVYGDHLPPELTPFREFGDEDVFKEWVNECPNDKRDYGFEGRSSAAANPHWDRTSGELYINGILYRKMKRSKGNYQWMILDAFQNNNWKKIIINPLGNQDKLENAVKSFNKSRNRAQNSKYVFLLIASRQSVAWSVRPA
jgi:hypothetical protein